MAGPIYTADGRQLVTESPAPEDWNTFVAGRIDKLNAVPPESKNGTGQPLAMAIEGPSEGVMEFKFAQPIFLQNGQIYFVGAWSIEDSFSFSVVMEPTVFDLDGDRNVISVDIGGGRQAWIPVDPGTGTHHFDNAKAIPVKSKLPSLSKWQVNVYNDVVSPLDGGGVMLVDFKVEAFFMRDTPVSPRREFVASLYKSEWISTKWTVRWSVTKVSSGSGQTSGWILTYRQDTT